MYYLQKCFLSQVYPSQTGPAVSPFPRDSGSGSPRRVMEVAARRARAGVDPARFEAAREAFVARLRMQEGVEVTESRFTQKRF